MIEAILNEVSSHFSIPLDELLGKSKARVFSYPRMVAMYLCYNLPNSSYLSIGKSFGRHHTTVMHAIRWAGLNQEMKPHIIEIWRKLAQKGILG